MEPIYQQIGEQIRKHRKAQKITQEELASHVGLTRASITNIEIGNQRLLVHTLIEIAERLEVSVGELLMQRNEITFKKKLPAMGDRITITFDESKKNFVSRTGIFRNVMFNGQYVLDCNEGNKATDGLFLYSRYATWKSAKEK